MSETGSAPKQTFAFRPTRGLRHKGDSDWIGNELIDLCMWCIDRSLFAWGAGKPAEPGELKSRFMRKDQLHVTEVDPWCILQDTRSEEEKSKETQECEREITHFFRPNTSKPVIEDTLVTQKAG